MSPTETPPKGVRKAAILLVLLGEEIASQIYRHLPQEDLEQLTQAIAELQAIDPKTALAVLEEYHRLDITQDYLAQGGSDYAQKLLVKAFGDEGARQLLKSVSYAAEKSSNNLDALQKSDPQQLAKFLENEHFQTIALILAHLIPNMVPSCSCACRRRCARKPSSAWRSSASFLRRLPRKFI